MIKIFTTLLLICWATVVFGQNYTFSVSGNSYSDLNEPISLNNGQPWVIPDFAIPIGFDFYYFNSVIDTLFLVPEQGGALLSTSDADTGMHRLINPFGAVLIDRGFGTSTSLSPISYSVTGIAPNRIFKLEWKNCGFFYDYEDDGESTDFVNFQLWLYEEDSKIQMHYGPSKITQPHLAYNYETGPQVSLIHSYYIEQDSISTSSIWLKDAPAFPNMIKSGNAYFLDGTIPTNKVYNFIDLTLHAHNLYNSEFRVFPNPIDEIVNIQCPINIGGQLNIQIFNLAGVKVFDECSENLSSNPIQIKPNLQKDGIYIIQINTKNHVYVSKIIKNTK